MTEDAVKSPQNKHLFNYVCFSINRRDLIILLAIYNISYFLSSELIRVNLKVCLLIAFLISLVSLFIFTLIHAHEKKNEDDDKRRKEDYLLTKKLKNEYRRIHRLKRKRELLMKAGAVKEKDFESVISELDDDAVDLEDTSGNTCSTVHIDYLKRLGTTRPQQHNF